MQNEYAMHQVRIILLRPQELLSLLQYTENWMKNKITEKQFQLEHKNAIN